MITLITVIHVVTCILLVLVVLLQSGKGAEISASFSGSSQTVFGSSGGANFFTKFTQGAATVFMITSLTLTVLGSQSKKSLFEGAPSNAPAAAPAAPAAAPVAVPAPAAPAAK
ncbi:preprotein translocase subunit SecG [Bdellovibrionota bacterium FG-2]